MKPGPIITICFLLTSIVVALALTFLFAVDSCSEYSKSVNQREQLAAEAKRKTKEEQANRENFSRLGNVEIKQGVLLYDNAQFRPAYHKFVVGVDHGGVGSDLNNSKVLVTLLSRGDYQRVLVYCSAIKTAPRVKKFGLGRLFDSGPKWKAYTPIFKLLALRASGEITNSKTYAKVEAAKFRDPAMWPAPLLMYFAGDFTLQELNEMLTRNPGPSAEADAILSLDTYMRGRRNASDKQQLKDAASRLDENPKWKAGPELLHPLCIETLRNM